MQETWEFVLKDGAVCAKVGNLQLKTVTVILDRGRSRRPIDPPLVSGGKMAPVLILGVGPCLSSALPFTCIPAASRAVYAWYDEVSTRGTSVRRSIPIRDDDDLAKPLGWVLRVKIVSFARVPVKTATN